MTMIMAVTILMIIIMIMSVIMIMINLSSVECVSVWHWAQPLEKPAVCLWWGCPQVRKIEKKQMQKRGY